MIWTGAYAYEDLEQGQRLVTRQAEALAAVRTRAYLERQKDNKLQSWLEQCIFGKGEHCATAKLEVDELNLALK